jgi:hypothetical protein
MQTINYSVFRENLKVIHFNEREVSKNALSVLVNNDIDGISYDHEDTFIINSHNL